jgi:glycosyltransferase involved in cell wall biosynthesis
LSELALVIIIPVFNDWESFGRLVKDIDATLPSGVREVRIVAVDDGSTEPVPDEFAEGANLQRIQSAQVVKLKCNLGHQRAIAVGLVQATEMIADAMIIMDADGEDRPQDIRLLIEQHKAQPGHLIVVSRDQRSEGLVFRMGYSLYKGLFKLLTGKDIRFGNFSLIPVPLVKRLVFVPSLWNHFAATVLHSRLPVSFLACSRGYRYAGESKMNLVNLVVHGLSAISVFSEVMLTRVLLFYVVGVGIGGVGILLVVAWRLFTNFAAPGWATTIISAIAIISLQGLLLATIAAFIVLNSRSTVALPPNVHAREFIDRVVTLYTRQS